MTNDRMQGNGHKLLQGRFRLDMRKKFYMKGWLGIGTGCPRMWWTPPSPEVYKIHVDVASVVMA